MTEKQISDLAKELYDQVMKEYAANPNLTMSDILNKHLSKYNDEVAAQIDSALAPYMSIGSSALPAVILPAAEISSRLYDHAKETAKAASAVINEHINNKSTIREIREALYDGYGYDELLPIKKELPKYLSKNVSPERINRLKTKPLKTAYASLLDAKNDRQLQKALKVALEERARYYALRMAITEEHKAFVLSNIQKLLDDDTRYVKVSLSGSHATVCVCDYHTSYDTGYGNGVYPINQAPMPPFHPFCKCMVSAVDGSKFKAKSNPYGSALKEFTGKQQQAIQNALNSKWEVKTVGEVFK